MSNDRRTVLKLRNIGFSYHRIGWPRAVHRNWIIRNATFNVFKGETLGIIGRNGVGKSTLLRIVAGIVDPDEGKVERSTNNIVLLALQAGFIPFLTGRQNALLGMMLLGLDKTKAEKKIEAVVRYAELESSIDMPLYTYSAGMRARLGFAVAIQTEPEVLLIDEILGVGDEAFRKKSEKTLKQIIASDRTVILVSHNLRFIMGHCHRVVWLRSDGLDVGEPEDVVAKYLDSISTGG